MAEVSKSGPRILGVTLGQPDSIRTYSGVPYHLFEEFKKMGCLAATASSFSFDWRDVLRGDLDIGRSLKARRPRPDALWRYRPRGMKALSTRFRQKLASMPAHDMVFQIGVGAMPEACTPLAAHVEISVATAIETDVFAKEYGFTGHNHRAVAEAVAGEREFLNRCLLVWTNSEWTAQGIMAQGVKREKIFVHPPAAGVKDPGDLDRDWNKCNILFVGVDWIRKGGPLLLEAFRTVRQYNPQARLFIVGCDPSVDEDGVEVFGYLRKNVPEQVQQLEKVYREATIFCMPSHWESTGIVYMEAACLGLPLVMLKGQGREEIFPSKMAVHVDPPSASTLSEALVTLSQSPEAMESMGNAGRAMVRENYTWEKLAPRLYDEFTCALKRDRDR